MNRALKLTTATALVVCAAASARADNSFEGDVKDAWLTGRIESMYLLNEHLSPFTINTAVANGVVTLTGTVPSEVDRDLAGALAENLEGVTEVENELVVDLEAAEASQSDEAEERRGFGTWVDDATTTAAVKSRLVGNQSTKGLQIDVDTNDDIVTLSGRVATGEEKDLAEQIALQVNDVDEVRNNLVVDAQR